MTTSNAERESAPTHSAHTVFSSMELAYLSIRRFVGSIALLLPCVLLLFGGAQHTISSYYYSSLRDVLVGTLCAIAVFLYFDRIPVAENVSPKLPLLNDCTGNVAAVAALGVAFFPTVREGESPNWQSYVHVASSILLFVCFIIFSLYLFRNDGIGQAGWRNEFHRLCGLIIIAAVVAAIVGAILHANIFWYETIAVAAFAASFVVKGQSGRRLTSALLVRMARRSFTAS